MTQNWPLQLQILISALKAIAMAAVLFICTQPSSFAAAQLKGFQLEQVLSGTRVVLMTSEAVNYRVQESSDQKIILEVDDVKSSQRLATQLNQSRNVHHVAIKSLPGNSLRLTIYGEKLGHPFVSFKTPEAPYTFAKPTTQTTSSLSSLSKNTANPIAEEEAFALPVVAEAEADSNKQNKAPIISNEDDEALDMTTLATEESLAVAGQGVEDRQAFESGPIEISAEPSIETTEPSIVEILIDFLVHVKVKDLFILTAISGILLVGLWFAIQLLQGREEPNQQPSKQKQPNFMAKTLSSMKHLLAAPKPTNKTKRPFKQVMQNQAATNIRPQQPNNSPQAGQSPNPQVNQLLNKNQASKAYNGQNIAPPKKKSFKDIELERELKRSLEMKYRMGGYNANRDTGARQQPAQQQPIKNFNPPNIANGNRIRPESNLSREQQTVVPKPSNPSINNTAAPNQKPITQGQDIPENKEVLDFLRSVADLMEKDGKPNLAQDIKRAISDS